MYTLNTMTVRFMSVAVRSQAPISTNKMAPVTAVRRHIWSSSSSQGWHSSYLILNSGQFEWQDSDWQAIAVISCVLLGRADQGRRL